MNLLHSIKQRLKKLEPTQPYIDVEFAIDESAIYKKIKLVPYVPDEILKRKGFKVFEEMMRDEEISSCIEALKIMRLSSGWEIENVSDDEKDIEIKEFVKFNLENVEGSFEADLFEIMGALEYGISISEIVWYVPEKGKYKNKILLKAIKSKNPRYFNILTDDFDNILEDGIVNISNVDFGKHYPVEKFIIYTFKKQFENVFGISRIRQLYDIWYYKQLWLRAWGIYLEKFGHPVPMAKYKKGMDKVLRDKIWEAIKTIKLETAIMVPEDVEIEFKEVSARGGDFFKMAIDYCNTQIRKVILGQTLTTDTAKGIGSYALGQIHFDVLLMYLEQLGRDIAEKVVNQQIIKRLVDYNFDNVENYPKFKFKPLIQKDIEKIIDKYYQGVEKGIIKPISQDEERLREWLGLPQRKIENQDIEKIYIEFQDDEGKIFTGVDRRRFTKYEEIVDFSEIKYQIENLKDKIKEEVSKNIKIALQDMIKQTEKINILNTKNLADFEKIKFTTTGEIKEIFKRNLLNAFENGISIARREIMNKKIKEKFSEIMKFQMEVDLRKIKPKEVLDWLEMHAYDLAGDIKDYFLSEYRDILKNAILRGDDLKVIVGALDKIASEYLEEGILDVTMTGGYKLEAIVRTNINQLMNIGRRQFFEDPQLHGFVIGYQYSAILDTRTSSVCQWLDQKTFSITYRDLEIITPPLHWNCRSLLIPITKMDKIEEFDNKLPPKNLLEIIYNFKKL